MIDLNKEAEEYSKLYYSENIKAKLGFIAGANSKYVKQQILQAQIDVLKNHIEHPTKPGYKRHDILNKIKELQQELKQLQDEN